MAERFILAKSEIYKIYDNERKQNELGCYFSLEDAEKRIKQLNSSRLQQLPKKKEKKNENS